jgi:GNAT superfamily N-acetyltransferase
MEDSNPDIWRVTEEGKKQNKSQMVEFMENSNSITFVAEEENRIIGYADGLVRKRETHLPQIVGHIGMIYVEKENRNKGVGTLLVKELVDHFRENDVDQVNLRYVIGNSEAEEFWSGFGFKPVIITALIGIDELEKQILTRT